MEIEKQVCSLELSKKLKELGVKQESLWYWVMYSSEMRGNGNYFLLSKKEFEKNRDNYLFPYSAYTVAELGEMLPSEVKCPVGVAKIGTNCKDFVYYYKSAPHIAICYSEVAKTEADARAKMLIWLIENKHLEIK